MKPFVRGGESVAGGSASISAGTAGFSKGGAVAIMKNGPSSDFDSGPDLLYLGDGDASMD